MALVRWAILVAICAIVVALWLSVRTSTDNNSMAVMPVFSLCMPNCVFDQVERRTVDALRRAIDGETAAAWPALLPLALDDSSAAACRAANVQLSLAVVVMRPTASRLFEDPHFRADRIGAVRKLLDCFANVVVAVVLSAPHSTDNNVLLPDFNAATSKRRVLVVPLTLNSADVRLDASHALHLRLALAQSQ